MYVELFLRDIPLRSSPGLQARRLGGGSLSVSKSSSPSHRPWRARGAGTRSNLPAGSSDKCPRPQTGGSDARGFHSPGDSPSALDSTYNAGPGRAPTRDADKLAVGWVVSLPGGDGGGGSGPGLWRSLGVAGGRVRAQRWDGGVDGPAFPPANGCLSVRRRTLFDAPRTWQAPSGTAGNGRAAKSDRVKKADDGSCFAVERTDRSGFFPVDEKVMCRQVLGEPAFLCRPRACGFGRGRVLLGSLWALGRQYNASRAPGHVECTSYALLDHVALSPRRAQTHPGWYTGILSFTGLKPRRARC